MKNRKHLVFLLLTLIFLQLPAAAFAMGEDGKGGVSMLTAVPPSITSGRDGAFTKGSSSGLTFGTNALKSDFEAVLVDGREIDSGNYTVSGDPLSFTLKASFLQTLSVGTHTVTLRTDTGSAETNFSVKSGQSGGPSTGDHSHAPLWTALLLLSAGALLTILFTDRKKRSSWG
ncbi:MAG: hypothetical protein MJ074_04250 [Oscillospiraceae bacterium]|nr:hypothetical protein [Oscillospiraceae bacterium]